MRQQLRDRLTFANVMSSVAVFLAISSGAAYAAGLEVFSEDIVDGEVKRVDIAKSAVVTSKLDADAVRGSKVLDGSLTGADLNQATLNGIVRIGGVETSVNAYMPDCAPGMDYLIYTFTAPANGYALVNASFTAGKGAIAGKEPLAARIEMSSPALIVRAWQEETLEAGAGRANMAVTKVFPAYQGSNTYLLKVCDGSDSTADASGQTIEGQITVTYSPFGI
jgi:hypothetical protein